MSAASSVILLYQLLSLSLYVSLYEDIQLLTYQPDHVIGEIEIHPAERTTPSRFEVIMSVTVKVVVIWECGAM